MSVSLIRTNCHYQLPFMIAENGNACWDESHGLFAVGDYWWQRIYCCRDGWIYVGASEESALEFSTLIAGVPDASLPTLESLFAAQNCEYWIKKLDSADIACHRVLTLEEILYEKPRPVDNEAADEVAIGALETLYWDDHPSGKPLTLMAPTWVRVGEDQSYKRLSPKPRYGQHTNEILQELGYNTDQIAELKRFKVVFDQVQPIGC